MKIFMILLAMICTHLHAEPTKGVRLPSITHVWADEANANLAPITIEEIRQCMGDESVIAKDYTAFNEAANLLKIEGMQFESLSKAIESERTSLDDAFKRINEKIAQLNDNSKKLDVMKAELNAVAKQKLDTKQAKEVNEKIVKYNQMAIEQNERAKNANLESDDFSSKQRVFNDKLLMAKRDFEQYNHKAELFEARRLEFNNRLAGVQEKCAGAKRLVK